LPITDLWYIRVARELVTNELRDKGARWTKSFLDATFLMAKGGAGGNWREKKRQRPKSLAITDGQL